MRETLYIAAKAPRPELAKTRLGRAIGPGHATALYRAFLADLGRRFATAPFDIVWYITPPDAWPEIAPLIAAPGRTWRTLAQPDGDWTARQRALFRVACPGDDDRAIILASDSPQITVELIARAFDELARHDAVIGPVHDGGYYLLGVRGPHDLLRDIPMSTGTVALEIVVRARANGLAIATLEATFDIDEAADLPHLHAEAERRPDLAATRAALAALDRADESRGTPDATTGATSEGR